MIGMSGGKDSLTMAMLCIEALGKERVIGVTMPMYDELNRKYIGESDELAKQQCEALGIRCYTMNILPAVQSMLAQVRSEAGLLTQQTIINLPARVRMCTLYAFAQSGNGRVACTSNLSEDYIGWNTRWGDMLGDFQPFDDTTASEVTEIMKFLSDKLEVPDELLPAVPADGLCGKSDEEAFGFSYEVLDKYIRTGVCGDPSIKEKIDKMHKSNEFKMKMPTGTKSS